MYAIVLFGRAIHTETPDKRALRSSKAGSGQARMRCRTHFERKVSYGDMHWASPVPDTRGVRLATWTVNA
jgi:hypothetical protein